MMKRYGLLGGLLLLTIVTAGCGRNLAREMCQRGGSCNLLVPGISVEECGDELQKVLDDLTTSKRADCEAQLAVCADKESCEGYLSCNIGDCS